MTKVAVLGECMIELSQQNEQLKQNFGGDTLNTAVYLARLLSKNEHQIAYVTALGDDFFSQQMLQQWKAEGIDTSLVQQLNGRLPGLYYILTDKSGERSFYYWRNEAAARDWLKTDMSDKALERLQEFDVVYLSGISLAILDTTSRARLFDVLEGMHKSGKQIVFDNNYRPRLWDSVLDAQQAYQQMLSCTDIAFLTLDDETALWGDEDIEQVIQRTQQWGVEKLILKRGAESCIIAEGKERLEVPAEKVSIDKVVDTTAAGDSFSAGYLASYLIGHSQEESARTGHKLASTVIQYKGAIIPLGVMESGIL